MPRFILIAVVSTLVLAASLYSQLNPKLYNLVPELQLSTIAPPVLNSPGELTQIQLMAWTVRGWVSVKVGAGLELRNSSTGVGGVELVAVPVPVPTPPTPTPTPSIARVKWYPGLILPSPPVFVKWNGLDVVPDGPTPDYTLAQTGTGAYTITPYRVVDDTETITIYLWNWK